jgi:hypothetical protein
VGAPEGRDLLGGHRDQGEAVQVEPMKAVSQAPLKLRYDGPLPHFAFKIQLAPLREGEHPDPVQHRQGAEARGGRLGHR